MFDLSAGWQVRKRTSTAPPAAPHGTLVFVDSEGRRDPVDLLLWEERGNPFGALENTAKVFRQLLARSVAHDGVDYDGREVQGVERKRDGGRKSFRHDTLAPVAGFHARSVGKE